MSMNQNAPGTFQRKVPGFFVVIWEWGSKGGGGQGDKENNYTQSPIPNPQSPIPNPQSPIPNPQSLTFQENEIMINAKLAAQSHPNHQTIVKISEKVTFGGEELVIIGGPLHC
jgi:hypothetical protein